MLRSRRGSAAGDARLAAPTAAAAQLAASARLARRAPTAAPPRSSGALAAASCGVCPRQRHHSRALGLPKPQAALARPPPVASRRLPGRPRAPASQPPPVSASGLPRPAAAKHPAARASVRRRLHAQLPAPGGTKGNILPNCCAIRQNMPCCIIALCPHFRGRARALRLCLPPTSSPKLAAGSRAPTTQRLPGAAPSHARPGTRAPCRPSSRAAPSPSWPEGGARGCAPPSLGSLRRGKPTASCNQGAKIGCCCGCCRSLLPCASRHRAKLHRVLHLCCHHCSRLS